MTIDVDTLIITQTEDEIYQQGLELAAALQLPVSSWRAGDPTRANFRFTAEILANLEAGFVTDFIRAGFLSKATADWLTVLAKDVYNVDRIENEPSEPTITITNTSGKFYQFDPGDLSVKASATSATFHTTGVVALATDGSLAPGATVTFTLIADVDGSAGTVAANDIDTLLSSFVGLTIVSSTAAVGVDEEQDPQLKDRCLATTGALSPNGPKDAYVAVVLNPALTGVNDISRATSIDDSTTGAVVVYVAGPSGAPAGASITAAQAAAEQWAEPLCHTTDVLAATSHSVAVTQTISGDNIPSDYLTRISAALVSFFSLFAIAKQANTPVPSTAISTVTQTTLILASVRNLVVHMSAPSPAVDPLLAIGEFPLLGALSVTQV